MKQLWSENRSTGLIIIREKLLVPGGIGTTDEGELTASMTVMALIPYQRKKRKVKEFLSCIMFEQECIEVYVQELTTELENHIIQLVVRESTK